MDEQQRKAHIRTTFDTVAEGYGSEPMAFFHLAASRLPKIFAFHGDEHLLDVATGTGIAISALAPYLLQGRVTGVDFSPGMLAQAARRLEGYDHVTLRQADMTALPFPEHSFDAANCSFGIFFVEDMAALLRHIASRVRPAGRIVTCSFMPDSFQPQMERFLECLDRFGVERPPFGWQRISTAEHYHALYGEAGLDDIRVHEHSIRYPLAGVDDWWAIIWNAGMRGVVEQLDADQQQALRREHLADIAALQRDDGLPLNVGVIFAEGRVA